MRWLVDNVERAVGLSQRVVWVDVLNWSLSRGLAGQKAYGNGTWAIGNTCLLVRGLPPMGHSLWPLSGLELSAAHVYVAVCNEPSQRLVQRVERSVPRDVAEHVPRPGRACSNTAEDVLT
jgi:hypothetical protein